ncbi:MAG: methionine--tRNA ligase subunit beta [Candidatus Omnitrophica bacterium]|nr:methionine--tRNA ligase subunit beta [Candidatus Omnitrophota bacterium]
MADQSITPSSPPVPAPAATETVTLDDFKKIQLKIAVIMSAEVHPQADRLLVLTLDIGGGQTRQVVAGIRGSYEPSALVGKQVVVVANLKPATIRGVESQGMVLATHAPTAVGAGGEGLAVLTPDRPSQPGSPVK